MISTRKLVYISVVFFGLFLFGLSSALLFGPGFSDLFYPHFVYPVFRQFWWIVSLGNRVDMIYVWIATLILWLFFRLRRVWKLGTGWKGFAAEITALAVLHFSWFYLSWGFLYLQKPMRDRLELNKPVSRDEYLNELYATTDRLISIRKRLARSNDELGNLHLTENEIIQLGERVHQCMLKLGLNRVDAGIVKSVFPEGTLLVWAASGVYWPFAGQGYYDPGIDIVQQAFTVAHEYGHVFGWTDEGECNLIAYLALQNSDNILWEYNAEYALWRYFMSGLSKNDGEVYREIIDCLPEEIRSDQERVKHKLDAFPEIFSTFRAWFYDFYLKANQVQGASRSYHQMVYWKINMDKRKEPL